VEEGALVDEIWEKLILSTLVIIFLQFFQVIFNTIAETIGLVLMYTADCQAAGKLNCTQQKPEPVFLNVCGAQE
jgi:hypothetical protein